jgi:2-oxoisovalerate dehydrogenase E1 component
MAIVNRARVVDENLIQALQSLPEAPKRSLDAPVKQGSHLTGRLALALFEAQATARHLDFAAREMRARGEAFYTIGSAGHEGNVVVGELLRQNDPCFLHYRSGALMARRGYKVPGESPIFDILSSLAACADDQISGGRHKVFGSKSLWVPPQTSTIASQLPKAVGAAIAISRAHRIGLATDVPEDGIVCVSFGDASANHSTAVGAINAALWASYQHIPVPLLFLCEDNGIGISVHTPKGWIQSQYQNRAGMSYFYGDGLDLCNAYDVAQEAIEHCRTRRTPTFLHMKTARLLGHAGSDVETEYHALPYIETVESYDPVRRTAIMIAESGAATPKELLAIYEEIRERVAATSTEVIRRPKLTKREDIMKPLAPFDAEAVTKEAILLAHAALRQEVFINKLPEADERPRHMAMLINHGLADMLAKYPESLLFGEDVAEKGGVYHVTTGLKKKFGVGRVFNSLLDEQSIFGLAIGAAHLGFLPIPEIQYLAYYHNAEDQIRGEAASLSYFSNGQFQNGMVFRVASLGYQKGFGGHFHNDNSITVLRDVPGLIIAIPSRGDDAVGMMRTALAAAKINGRITAFLEPIALYMTKDLHQENDGGWLFKYPAPGTAIPLGEARLYQEGEGKDFTILTYGNGTYMSLRVARRLAAQHGLSCRIIDLRWIAPLDRAAIVEACAATGKVLIVDEGRRSGGVCEALCAVLIEEGLGQLPVEIVVGADVYIPLGDAAYEVLPSEAEIVQKALALVQRQSKTIAEVAAQ